MKKKLFVLGASGLIGQKVVNAAKFEYDVFGTFNKKKIKVDSCEIFKLNISNLQETKKILFEIKPDFVINTIALLADSCEDNQDFAFKINVDFVKTIRDYCDELGSKLINFSSDYVFDGKKEIPYKESDTTNPLSVYGKTKVKSEKLLENTEHLTIRTAVVYGWNPQELLDQPSSSGKLMNFGMWLLTKFRKKESMKIVTDQFSSATLADTLSDAILKILKNYKAGLYHVTGLSCETRYDFAFKLAEKFGYDSSLLTKIKMSELKQKTQKPVYGCLECTKAKKQFRLNLMTTEEAFDFLKKQIELEDPDFVPINK